MAPELKLYNTMTRRVDPFTPREPGRVRMYTCGPTVYDFGHIGNFRTFVAVDVLQRYLRSRGLELDTVMNITDVDDKMIERSRSSGQPLRAIGDKYAAAFLEDMERLRILPAKRLVRATDFIPRMVAWIERLVASGHAYEREGSVYFRLASFPEYGRLSGKDLGGLKEGARVEVDEYDKEAARDFALWKAQREGEPAWESPWGMGRPGWHIECSVMAASLLGETLDLHAGGADLVFPHHENEIAQVEPLTHRPFSRCWFHCEFLLVNGEKMSKRAGNFYTVRDLLEKGYAATAIRYLLASAPYGRQLNFTLEGLQQAGSSLQRLRALRERLRREPPAAGGAGAGLAAAREQFQAALANNLNTAEALAVVFEAARRMNTALDAGAARAGDFTLTAALLADFDEIFCVLEEDGTTAGRSAEAVEALLRQRAEARAGRDFARSDALRRQLDEMGVVVEDGKGGETRWHWKS